MYCRNAITKSRIKSTSSTHYRSKIAILKNESKTICNPNCNLLFSLSQLESSKYNENNLNYLVGRGGVEPPMYLTSRIYSPLPSPLGTPTQCIMAPRAGIEPAKWSVNSRLPYHLATADLYQLFYSKFCKRTRTNCRHFIIRVSMITAKTLISSFFTNNCEIPTTNSILLQKTGIVLNHCCTKQPNDNPNNKFHNIINHYHSTLKQDR